VARKSSPVSDTTLRVSPFILAVRPFGHRDCKDGKRPRASATPVTKTGVLFFRSPVETTWVAVGLVPTGVSGKARICYEEAAGSESSEHSARGVLHTHQVCDRVPGNNRSVHRPNLGRSGWPIASTVAR
jgi:hypothetical protein